MTTFWASVLVFGLLILFHELGHFTIAKLVGIKVHEFSMGFGPKLVGFKKGETRYNLRAFPLGGFVRMAGMDPEEEDVEEGRGFNEKTVWQRMGVIFAGPLMNFVLAALLVAVIYVVQGIPVASSGTKLSQVVPGYPAAEAGLKAGDKIVAINDRPVERWDEVVESINRNPEREIEITVDRNGKLLELYVVPQEREDGKGFIGIMPQAEYQRMDPLSAVFQGAKYTVQVTALIFQFIGKMIFGQEPADLGGPVRVVYEISRAAEFGMVHLLNLAAILSINLGLFNLFPVPALDGSRLVFLVLEKVRGKPVDPEKENFIHLVGFSLLLLFILVITYNDLLQLYSRHNMLP